MLSQSLKILSILVCFSTTTNTAFADIEVLTDIAQDFPEIQKIQMENSRLRFEVDSLRKQIASSAEDRSELAACLESREEFRKELNTVQKVTKISKLEFQQEIQKLIGTIEKQGKQIEIKNLGKAQILESTKALYILLDISKLDNGLKIFKNKLTTYEQFGSTIVLQLIPGSIKKREDIQ